MKPALKILGLIVLTICVLSITVKNETIFSYIYNVISPATKLAQRGTITAYEYSAEKARDYTRRIFDNSVPKTDSLKSRQSSTLRKGQHGLDPQEAIELRDKEELDELIKEQP